MKSNSECSQVFICRENNRRNRLYKLISSIYVRQVRIFNEKFLIFFIIIVYLHFPAVYRLLVGKVSIMSCNKNHVFYFSVLAFHGSKFIQLCSLFSSKYFFTLSIANS